VCDECDLVANADVNGAENIRKQVTSSPQREDRSNGWLAQPSTYLFDKGTGSFEPQERLVS
jgi:transposase